MNVLPFRHRGTRRADPDERAETVKVTVSSTDPRVMAALAEIQAQVAAEQDGQPEPEPAPEPVTLADDYRDLPVFQNVVRAACRAGMTGLGTRGVHPVMPVLDYGLDRFRLAPVPDDCEAEFDEIAERAEAGFVQARRVFHRADSATFPAVVA